MKLYIIIKVGQQDGAFGKEAQTLVQTEAAYLDKTKAEAVFLDKVKLWKEFIDGVSFECVRALHEIDITE